MQLACEKAGSVCHTHARRQELRARKNFPSAVRCRAAAGPKLILGIETSCDDTGVAVVTSEGKMLGEVLATQAEIHAPWGGVVPMLAMEAHQEAIDRCVEEALEKAGVAASDLDAVAVTLGPGLGMCLKGGVSLNVGVFDYFSQGPKRAPYGGVIETKRAIQGGRDCGVFDYFSQGPSVRHTGGRISFPFLCMLVSGGHNLLLQVNGVGQYVQLGSTMDDALGEAYDKIARMLGLDLRPNGGAALEALALEGNPKAYRFVRPLLKYKTCDFSYAGLKTAVRLCIEKNLGKAEDAGVSPSPSASGEGEGAAALESPERRQIKADIAASFQLTATNHLLDRVRRAISWVREDTGQSLKHLVVAGGVASNTYIRAQLSELCTEEGIELVLPPPKWCTDNGVMVAWAGVERLRLGYFEQPLEPLPIPTPEAAHNGGLIESGASPKAVSKEGEEEEWIELRPRWPLTTEMHPNVVPAANQKSARKARLFTSLSELTAERAALSEK
eukprot:gene28795-31983_t